MLKRIRYNTMNSWNKSTAPAYNLKVHQVIPQKYRAKVYELMDCEGFYDDINDLIREFGEAHAYEWQAGFNGRSGGYLVLYRGGRRKSEHKSICRTCGQRNFTSITETGTKCGRCGANSRVDHEFYDVFTLPGKEIAEGEAPGAVLQAFAKLARDIVADAIHKAKNLKAEEETYTEEKTRKVLTAC